ncbi:TonB-dependent receptor [uncultured Duncaniella sp.]|uniref:TonB-dependent receptor domain-containing protein n=1 Tax=uncultured Duncaniella sp. TaxID=2768039 RepID=UPI0025A9B4AD|nr:TonB-dependent receptor [uncultured Duncaniella sp.]
MRYISAITLLAISHLLSPAKDITGTLIDETGQPASFVNVILMKDSTFIDGKTTDDTGLFIFENADSLANKVKITMIGYEDMVLPIPEDGNYNTISLKPSTIMLGEVVVKGDLPSTRIKGNAFVTRVENSILSTTGSANDVLKNIPMATGTDGKFSVFGRGDAIIYVNGRLVRSSDEVGQLSSGDIKEIQVINNPGAQYGANVNAVIRIVTKKPVGEGFSISAYTDNIYNKWFTTKEQLNLKYRTGGLEIFGMGYFRHGKTYDEEYTLTTSYGKSLLEMISDQSVSTTQSDITGKIGFNYQLNENHSLGAYYQHDYNRGHHFGHYLNDIKENEELSESSVSDLKGRFKALPCNSANIYYNGTIGKFTVDVNADYMQTKDNDHSYQYEQNESSDNRNVTTFNTTRNRLFAEKASISYELPKGNILIGEEYTNSRSRNDFRNPESILNSELTDVRESNMGVFAEVSQTFGKFSATAGARYEHVKSDYRLNGRFVDGQSKTYSNLFPSANLT